MTKKVLIKLKERIEPGIEPYYHYGGSNKRALKILRELDFNTDKDGLYNYHDNNGLMENWVDKLKEVGLKVIVEKVAPDVLSLDQIENHIKNKTDEAKQFYKKVDFENRLSSGFKQLDKILGGGFVPYTTILLGGEKGGGKSTLATQIALNMSKEMETLYVSSEEQIMNIKYRFERLSESELTEIQKKNLFLFCNNDYDIVEYRIRNIKPKFCVFDSVSGFINKSVGKRAGTVSQVLNMAEYIRDYHKHVESINSIIICHVNKNKDMAGPEALQHLYDVNIKIENTQGERMLSADKNRYGDTSMLGVMTMNGSGLHDIDEYDPESDAENDAE